MRKVSEGVFVREREGEGGKVDSSGGQIRVQDWMKVDSMCVS